MKKLQLSFLSNKTTVRLLNILEFIERKKFFTLRELADKSNVSERTIATDVKYLKEYFGDCAMFTSGSKGYLFEEIDLSKYKEQKKELFVNECLFEIIEHIFYGEFEHMDELAHRYNYSESTFRRLIVHSNAILEEYDLCWSSNPLKIEGNEASLRKFFKDFFYEGIETPYTFIPDSDLQEFILRKGEVNLGYYEVGTGTTPQAFYYTLFIAIKRFSQGECVSVPIELQKRVYQEKDFSVLQAIAKIIEREYKLKLSNEELAWVYLITVCKRTVDRCDQEKLFYQRFNLWPEIDYVTEQFLAAHSISSKDQLMIAPFINAFFLSRKINELLAPVLNKEMLDYVEYVIHYDQKNFEINRKFLQKYQDQLLFTPAHMKEICASLTLYSTMIVENYSSPKKILFLLEGNHFICQSIRSRVIKLYGSQHQLQFVPLQMLSKDFLKNEAIDLIVTNYSRYVSNLIGDTNYLLIKEVPDEQDWLDIAERINPTNPNLLFEDE